MRLSDDRAIEYVHDPLGRRIAKVVDGDTVEKYLWQGLTRLLAVYDSSDNLIMRFEYADGRMPVAMTKGGTTYYLTYDQAGSLRVVADATGTVVKRIDYDAFGNIINDTNPSFDVPFAFAGGLQDQDTGLVRFGFRDYDPDTGRWTAKDPNGFWGGDTVLYGYCLNDPANFLDPSGLFIRQTIGHLSTAWGGITAGGPGALIGCIVGTAVGGALGGVPGAIIVGGAFGMIGSAFDSPSAGQLNYLEDLELEHLRNMEEWEKIDKKVNELLEKATDLNNRMGGPLSHDDDPC